MSQEILQVDKPKQKVKKSVQENKQQWETFFDPQYTFGSFQTEITKPSNHINYKEKRFLNQESYNIPNSEPSSPTLPDLKQLQLHINTIEQNNHDDTQIKILPRPFPKYNKNTDQILCKERLELLNIIQVIGFNKQNDTRQLDPYAKISTTARLQLHLKKKAEQMKREILLDSDEEESNSIQSNEQDIPKNSTSLISLDDSYENISFKESNQVQEKDLETKRKNRTSFLYFAFGFIFPPLWIIGAIYVPNKYIYRSPESKSIDKKWKLYSRNALFSFIIVLVAITVLIIILKPEAIGFRNSLEGGYNADKVVFDDQDFI